jgi:protein O-GlcNAc transferase
MVSALSGVCLHAFVFILCVVANGGENTAETTTRTLHGGYDVDPGDVQKQNAMRLNDYALKLVQSGDVSKWNEAESYYLKAFKLDPKNWMVSANLAVLISNMEAAAENKDGKAQLWAGAKHYSEIAMALNPTHSGLLSNHGMLLKDHLEVEGAIEYYKRALRLDPLLIESHCALGDIYMVEMADEEMAERQFRAAQTAIVQSKTNDVELKNAGENLIQFRILNSMIPNIYRDEAHVLTSRARYQHYLHVQMYHNRMDCSQGLVHSAGGNSFGYYLVYQGGNDLPERAALARVYRRCARQRLASVYHGAQRIHGQPLRVGFVSAKLFSHSVGKLIAGVIRMLGKSPNHHVVVYFLGQEYDHLSDMIARDVDEAKRFPVGASLEDIRQNILLDKLDVLIYPELGMDTQTYFLAFHRLAHVQAMFWGHPVTAGIEDTMDYFITSKNFHLQTGDNDNSKFVEKLYFMDGITTYFYRPPPADERVTLDSLRLTSQANIYACLQTAFKITPVFDRVIASILSADENAVVLLMSTPTLAFGEKLKTRLEASHGLSAEMVERVMFLKPVEHAKFLGLARLADVALDPFPFGGGVTTLEILSTGTPVVALPNRTTVLQLTRGFYVEMDSTGFFEDCCLANTIDDYVKKAVHIATSQSYRERVVRRIHDLVPSLYEQTRVIQEWVRFFDQVSKPPVRSSTAPRSEL